MLVSSIMIAEARKNNWSKLLTFVFRACNKTLISLAEDPCETGMTRIQIPNPGGGLLCNRAGLQTIAP
jgi:hypothetical protein